MMVCGIDYIGKYEVQIKRKNMISTILRTDNCREAVWAANMDPSNRIPMNANKGGTRDFYMDDGKWHSYEI